MKKPRISLLATVTIVFAAFTLGLFIGRSYCGVPMSVTVSPQMHMPLPTASASLPAVASEETDDSFPIDINTASLQELTVLPGIGEGLAGQIVAYRDANGRFSHTEELMNVPGIGEGRLEAILSLITAGGTE